MRNTSFAALPLVLVLGACQCQPSSQNDGGNDDAGATLADAGISAATFCALYAQMKCARDQACGQYALGLQDHCQAQLRTGCETALPRIASHLNAFQLKSAEGCLKALAAPHCGQTDDSYPYCSVAFVATAKVGDPCSWGDCQNSYCDVTGNCGVCRKFAEPGEPCLSTEACNPDSGYCEYPPPDDGGPSRCQPLLPRDAECTSGYECQGGVCVYFPLIDGGVSRCGPQPSGAPCLSAYDCAATAYCKGAQSNYLGQVLQVGACTQRLPFDAGCVNEQYDDGCAEFAFCLDGFCQNPALGTLTRGNSCEFSGQCRSTDYCNKPYPWPADAGASVDDGQCVELPGSMGTCGYIDDIYVGCRVGQACVTSYRCVPYATEGQTCGDNATCIAPLRCSDLLSGGSYRCVAPRTVGQSCKRFSTECVSSFCDVTDGGELGFCHALLPLDAGCTYWSDCASESCNYPSDGGQPLCVSACF